MVRSPSDEDWLPNTRTTANLRDYSHDFVTVFNSQGPGTRVPLFSHIIENLWIGGEPSGPYPDEFVEVFSLNGASRKLQKGSTRVYHSFLIQDSRVLPDMALMLSMAKSVVRALGRGPTLLHCQAGINRSPFLGAMVLIQLGHSAQGAINLIGQRRNPIALCNTTFRNWLISNYKPT